VESNAPLIAVTKGEGCNGLDGGVAHKLSIDKLQTLKNQSCPRHAGDQIPKFQVGYDGYCFIEKD